MESKSVAYSVGGDVGSQQQQQQPLTATATATTTPTTTAAAAETIPVARVVEAQACELRVEARRDLESTKLATRSRSGVGVLFLRIGETKVEGAPVGYLVPQKFNLVTVLHGAKLDLRRAAFVHPHTVISAVSVLGGLKIWVPPNVNVVVSGSSLAILGGIRVSDYWSSPAAPPATTQPPPAVGTGPTLEISAVAVLGGIKVYVDRSMPPAVLLT